MSCSTYTVFSSEAGGKFSTWPLAMARMSVVFPQPLCPHTPYLMCMIIYELCCRNGYVCTYGGMYFCMLSVWSPYARTCHSCYTYLYCVCEYLWYASPHMYIHNLSCNTTLSHTHTHTAHAIPAIPIFLCVCEYLWYMSNVTDICVLYVCVYEREGE